MRRQLIKLWFDYQGAGTPYGNTFNGLIEWLIEQEIRFGK